MIKLKYFIVTKKQENSAYTWNNLKALPFQVVLKRPGMFNTVHTKLHENLISSIEDIKEHFSSELCFEDNTSWTFNLVTLKTMLHEIKKP